MIGGTRCRSVVEKIGDLDTKPENHRKYRGSGHDAIESLKRKRDLNTMSESRQKDRGSGHDGGEP